MTGKGSTKMAISTEDEASPTRINAADKSIPKEDEPSVLTSTSEGIKRKQNESRSDLPKKAKIAMPPPVSSSITDVEKYKLESPPPAGNNNAVDAEKKIVTPNLMLFGLHPLIRASPLQKLLEEYGVVKAITVRSAFASRYGHITFETIEEARKCYVAINGAKLLHKVFLVQPSMASATDTSSPAPAPATSTEADKKAERIEPVPKPTDSSDATETAA